MNHGRPQPLNREGDHGSNPEVTPYPVAEDPQSTDGEVRHGHFALEGIARWPAYGCRGRIGENRMRNEIENASDPDGYHEESQQEDLRYPSLRSGLPV